MLELLPIVAVALIFWLLIIRPASRRQKELSRMQGSLTVGDEVMLTSGILGTVEEIADDHIAVLVADGVVIRVVRGAVGSIVQPAPREDDTDSADGSAGDGPEAV